MKQHLLVVDDEPDIRELLKEILDDEGYEVEVAHNAEAARAARRQRRPDLVLLDIWMPDTDGISLLKEWSESGAVDGPVIMMSGHGTVETAVEATRLGAYDFIEKPLSMAKLLLTVRNALAAAGLKAENRELRVRPAVNLDLPGRGAAMEQLRERAERAAAHEAPVLISGEPGSGKAALAKFIHDHGARTDGPFTRLSAATLASADGDAELFGMEDEERVHYGALESANGGTLFLDDIADLPPSLQTRLFGALETRSFVRVGGVETVRLDAHVIVATSRDLAAEVDAGRFRNDLYYLVQVLPLEMPALREHLEDLPELLESCVDQLVSVDMLPYRRFTVASQNRLRNYHWPGNLRELRNLVQRLLILGDGGEISPAEVDLALGATAPVTLPAIGDDQRFGMPLKEAREQFERAYFEHHLREEGGSVSKVAAHCGLERTHLYRKLRTLGIDVKQIAG
jgi:two-component system, NtrC family, nitrogen regulation response regulator NtrX